MIWGDLSEGADRERGVSLTFLFLESRGEEKGVTGFKRVRTEKSLKSQVKKSVLNCASGITCNGQWRKDENVKMWLSGGPILNVSPPEIRAEHLFLLLRLPVSVTDLRGLCISFAMRYSWYSAFTQPPRFSAVCMCTGFIWPIRADMLCWSTARYSRLQFFG